MHAYNYWTKCNDCRQEYIQYRARKGGRKGNIEGEGARAKERETDKEEREQEDERERERERRERRGRQEDERGRRSGIFDDTDTL